MKTVIAIVFMIFGVIIFASVFGLVLAFPIKWTWNYVMPYLFDFKEITWGQAWCLNFLAGCLIKATQINTNKR